MTEEIWLPLKDWPYEVSDQGRVRRAVKAQGTVAGHILKPGRDSGGYRMVDLCSKPRRKHYKVAILVCRAFHGEPQAGREVCHNDGDRTNDCKSNLRWGTPKENSADRTLHGTQPIGEKHPNAQLTREAVAKLRQEFLEARVGLGKVPNGWHVQRAAQYGIKPETVGAVCRGTCWKSESIAYTKGDTHRGRQY
jgi:hypothetical protein